MCMLEHIREDRGIYMKKNFSITGIVIGIIIVIMGLVMVFGSGAYGYRGDYTSSARFGADFYTEQYAATQNAANNIMDFGNYFEDFFVFVVRVFGFFISAIGGLAICYFGCKLGEVEKVKKGIVNNAFSNKQPVPVQPTYTQPVQPTYTQPVQPMQTQPVVQQNLQTHAEDELPEI